ncbi:MAG: PglZ domain-containing protein [Methylocella sp.]
MAEGSSRISGWSIYHNTVDAIGHDGKTEGHTFEAVRWTLTKLSALVGVTADHGFR